MEVGGWVQVSLGIFLGKSSQIALNSRPLLIFSYTIMSVGL